MRLRTIGLISTPLLAWSLPNHYISFIDPLHSFITLFSQAHKKEI